MIHKRFPVFLLVTQVLLVSCTDNRIDLPDPKYDPATGISPTSSTINQPAKDSEVGLTLEHKVSKKKQRIGLVCKEICHGLGSSAKLGNVVKFKSYDPNTQSCICTNFRGVDISRKLYKGEKTRPGRPEAEAPKPVGVSPRSERKGRQVTLESIADTGERIVSLPNAHGSGRLHGAPTLGSPLGTVVPADAKQGHFGHGPGIHNDFHGHHDVGCTPLSCIDSCPRHCDSLCRYSGECYCSCPEDLTYEYYDEGFSLASLFG